MLQGESNRSTTMVPQLKCDVTVAMVNQGRCNRIQYQLGNCISFCVFGPQI